MREIKFRAWDKEVKKIIKPEDIIGLEGETSKNLYQSWELMQFTGLTDKNGVEIYEGDIVQMPNWAYPTEVIFFKEKCRFCCQLRGGVNDYIPHHSIVIGNIYENKDLL